MSFLFNLLPTALQRMIMSTPSYTPITQSRPAAWESPSIEDVLKVKRILLAKKLPIEIVDAVIDHAEYWPRTSANTKSYSPNQVRAFQAQGSTNRENIYVIRSLPLGFSPQDFEDRSTGNTDRLLHIQPEPVTLPERSSHNEAAREALLKKCAEANLIRGKHPCRKIVFKISSHDQGWGGSAEDRGTFNGSYTWFSAGIDRLEVFDPNSFEHSQFASFPVTISEPGKEKENTKAVCPESTKCILRTIKPGTVQEEKDGETTGNLKFDHPLLPPPDHIVRNRTAHRETQNHVVTWHYQDDISPDSDAANELSSGGRGLESGTGEFVRNLEVGDAITIWTSARFPGWANHLEECSIEVYWAV